MIRSLIYAIITYGIFRILMGALKGYTAASSDSSPPYRPNNRTSGKEKGNDIIVDLCPDCGEVLTKGHRCRG